MLHYYCQKSRTYSTYAYILLITPFQAEKWSAFLGSGFRFHLWFQTLHLTDSKSCMKLTDGTCVICREHTEKDDPSVTRSLYHLLSNEPDYKNLKLWLSETVEKYPGCQLLFYPKFHCRLNFFLNDLGVGVSASSLHMYVQI